MPSKKEKQLIAKRKKAEYLKKADAAIDDWDLDEADKYMKKAKAIKINDDEEEETDEDEEE